MKETMSYIIWTIFGYWFATKKGVPVCDQSVTETAPAARTAINNTTGPVMERPEQPSDTTSCEGSIITSGLSEMLKRHRARRNLRRRKEDQAS